MNLDNTDIDRILTEAVYEFVFDWDSPEDKYDKVLEGYVKVQIPTSGFYNGYWTYRLETYEEVMEDNMASDWYERDGMMTKDLYERLKESKAWKEFISKDEDVQKALGEDHFLDLNVPVSLEEIGESSCKALASVFDTYCSELIGPKNIDIQFAGIWSPSEYNFESDKMYAYIPEKMWKALCQPEVFMHEAFKAWAKYWSTPHPGYVPLHSYDEFFDPESPICKEAVMLFWCAQLLAAKKHYIDLDLSGKIDEDFAEQDCGISSGAVGYELDTLGSEEEEPEWEFEKCYTYTIEK